MGDFSPSKILDPGGLFAKTPSAPPPPDPYKTAAAQTGTNINTATASRLLNQTNQFGPQGSSVFNQIGSQNIDGHDVPQFEQVTSLNPTAQRIFEGQQNVGAGLTDFAQQFVPRVAEGLSTPFNTANAGVDRPVANDAERQRIETALMGRLQPYLDRDQSALDNRLANQGIGLGSEAFGAAQDDFGRQRTDARLATIGAAGGEYARDFGMQQSSYQQALSDQLMNRTQGINEVSALLNGAPAIQNPSMPQVAQSNIAPANLAGGIAQQYQGQLNNFNQQQEAQNAKMGGLMQLGGMAGMAAFSDRRLKTDIKRVGKTDGGTPVYTYRFKSGGPVQMGVMADEAPPEAVIEIDGIKRVYYSMVA